MDHWGILIILLIAFGTWILSAIFKTDENAKNKERPRRSEGTRIPRRPAPARDIVREIPSRRRDMPEGMESSSSGPRAAPIPTPRRPVAAVRLPGARRAAPVLATIIEEPSRPGAVVKPPEATPVLQPLLLPPALTPATGTPRDRPGSPVLQEVVRLLRSPRTAAAALVMREILDRPIGLRRR